MPIRKPVPVILPWLTALAAAPLVLIVAAVAAVRFGGVDLSVGHDLLTWTVARALAWVGLAGAVVAVVLALRDIRGRGAYALAALVFAGAAVVGFMERQGRDATPTPRDVTTNVAAAAGLLCAPPPPCIADRPLPPARRWSPSPARFWRNRRRRPWWTPASW